MKRINKLGMHRSRGQTRRVFGVRLVKLDSQTGPGVRCGACDLLRNPVIIPSGPEFLKSKVGTPFAAAVVLMGRLAVARAGVSTHCTQSGHDS